VIRVRGRVATGVLAWLVAVAAATAVGIAAVNVIGSGIAGSGPRPLSQSEVEAQLAVTPTTTAPPATPSATTSTGAVDQPTVIPVQGGTIIARCAPGGVAVLSATPAQGYQVSSKQEVDDHPKVRFISGRTEVEVRLRCVAGAPQPEVEVKH
jgi:hypothetical protein